MGRFKHSIDYNRGDGIVEVNITDHTGARIDKFKANQRDKKAHGRIGAMLKDKYGIDLTPILDDDFFSY